MGHAWLLVVGGEEAKAGEESSVGTMMQIYGNTLVKANSGQHILG